MQNSAEQQIAALMIQAMRTALALIDAAKEAEQNPPHAKARPKSHPYVCYAPGIYAARSKYNPYRAYVRSGDRSIYTGMFPTIAEAQAAQIAYYRGQQHKNGTRVANGLPPLEIVKRYESAQA